MPEIPPEKVAAFLEGELNKVLRDAVLFGDAKLKDESPVDTGRFRGSWRVGQNANTGEAGLPPTPSAGGEVYPSPSEPIRTNYRTEKIGEDYYLYNNLPYAERLADGWSGQAPAGWVDVIAKRMQVRMNRKLREVGR